MKSFCAALCCCCCIKTNSKNEKWIDKSNLGSWGMNENGFTEANDNGMNTASNQNTTMSNNPRESDSLIPILQPLPEPINILAPYLHDDLPDDSIFEDNLYLDFEKGKIKYSERSIVALYEYFHNENTPQNFNLIHDKDNMKLYVDTKGCFLSNEFPLIKMTYFLPKSDFPKGTTINNLSYHIVRTEKRPWWDTGIKSYSLIKGDESNKCIVHITMSKPVFFISERDIVDKKYDFFYKNSFYSFENSVTNELVPEVKDITRIVDYVCLYKISEDENNFYFYNYTQVDFKMNTPQSLMNVTLPVKLKEWYKNIKKYMNKEFANGFENENTNAENKADKGEGRENGAQMDN